MKKKTLVLSFLVLFVVLQTYAVDRTRFKTCSQSDFCRRNREFGKAVGLSPYNVIQSTEQLSSTRYMVDIENKLNGEKFLLTITNYENDILRIRISEKAPLHSRYEVKDVLLETIKKQEATKNGDLIFGKVKINYSPFELSFYSSDGSEEIIRANSNGLFNIEHYREKIENIVDPNIPTEELVKEIIEGEPISPYKAVKGADVWDDQFQSHVDSRKKGPSSISMDFSFVGSNFVYGIPQHADSFSLKSTKHTDPYRLYNLDVFEYELDETMALYGSIPLMISHKPTKTTAVFWLNASETWIDIDKKEKSVDTHWYSESGLMDFFILSGPTPADLYKQYSYLTGTAPVPPLFSIAYHQCRWNYKDQPDVLEVDSKFDEFDIPYDVIWLDIEHTDQKKYFTWDPIKFPQPAEMLAALGSKGRKLVNIVDPHIKKDSSYAVYSGANSKNFWVKNKDGQSDYEGHCWPGTSMYLDFTNPDVRKYWADQYSYSSYPGSGKELFIWNDMNEPSVFNGPEVTMQKDLIHWGNVEHRDIHNLFGFYVHKGTSEGLAVRDTENRRPFVLSRAFFAGSQRWGAIWTGDNKGEWDHLKISIPMLLSISSAGLSFCGADVGGFFGNTEEELMIRWYQAGAFQPFFRAHAHLDTKRREPYLFQRVDLLRQAIRNRYQLLSFWYTCFYEHYNDGLPVMRALWMNYPNDEESFSIEHEYIVGSNLLVAPATGHSQINVNVYFPAGGWYDFFDHQFIDSVGYKMVAAPLDKIPAYQRAGSVLPLKLRARRSSTQMVLDPYTLVVALDKNQQANGSLYIDDYFTFEYQRSAVFQYRQFQFANNELLSHSEQNPVPGQEQVFVERIVILGLDHAVTSAFIHQQGFKLEAPILTETDPSGNPIYIIRKPNALISYDWKIEIK